MCAPWPGSMPGPASLHPSANVTSAIHMKTKRRQRARNGCKPKTPCLHCPIQGPRPIWQESCSMWVRCRPAPCRSCRWTMCRSMPGLPGMLSHSALGSLKRCEPSLVLITTSLHVPRTRPLQCQAAPMNLRSRLQSDGSASAKVLELRCARWFALCGRAEGWS